MTELASPAVDVPSAAALARRRLLLGLGCGLLTSLIWGVQAVVSRQSVADGLTAADVTILRFAIASLLAALALLTLIFKTILEFRFGDELAGNRRH